MKISHQMSGKKIKGIEGYEAFIPNPLPPNIKWSDKILRVLSEADRAIGNLAGEGRQLSNPHLLIRPFIKREAVLSSRIEGTQSTLGEVLAVEVGSKIDRSPDDLREVANYVRSLEYGIERLKSLPLSLRLIREIHEKLMDGVRGNQATPGEFRRSQNRIGPPGCTLQNASYIPPPPHEMTECLGQLEKFLHDRSLPPLIQIALAHYQFEAIHPFLDGNGRIGRLLIILFLIERRILPTPLLYLSAFFEASRTEYYNHLKAVSEISAFESWIEYFLTGITRQAEDASFRAQAVNNLIMQWKKELIGSVSKVPILIIEQLSGNPYCTTKSISKKLNIAFTTAGRSIDRLVSKNILVEVSKNKRDRVYCATELLTILEAPVHLT